MDEKLFEIAEEIIRIRDAIQVLDNARLLPPDVKKNILITLQLIQRDNHTFVYSPDNKMAENYFQLMKGLQKNIEKIEK